MNLLNDAADAVKEPWEIELVAFLRVCKTEVKAKLEKRAQEFADRLDAVGHSGKRLYLILTVHPGS